MISYEILGRESNPDFERGRGDEYEVGGGPYTIGAASAGGFDAAFGIDAGSELLKRVVSEVQTRQQSTKTKAETDAQLSRAKNADIAWARGEQMLDQEQSAVKPDPVRIAAASALASQTSAEAAAAGAGLPQDAISQRVSAANSALKDAADASHSDPGSGAKASLLRAWQKVAGRAGLGGGSSFGGGGEMSKYGSGVHGSSWWTKQSAGIPNWGWVAGGTVTGIGAVLLVRSLFKKKVIRHSR